MKSTIFLQGGLGNQLFQYAFGRNLEINHNVSVEYSSLLLKLPLDVTPRQLEIRELVENKLTNKPIKDISSIALNKIFFRNKIVTDKNLNIDFIKENKCDVIGFFQAYKYIDEIWENEGDRLLSFLKMDKGAQNKTNYLAIHLRLGDYLNSKKTKRFHGLSAPTYFFSAARKLSYETGIDKFIVVTDSPKEAKNFLRNISKEGLHFEIVSNNHLDDLKTIYQSRGAILSNSSFSWWGGYLAWKVRDIPIIVPSPWYYDAKKQPIDLCPEEWMKVDRKFHEE